MEAAAQRVRLHGSETWVAEEDDGFRSGSLRLWALWRRQRGLSGRPTSADILWQVQLAPPLSLRGLAPFCRLVRYGDFCYGREDYPHHTTMETRTYVAKPGSKPEPWMLPEVEEAFRRFQDQPHLDADVYDLSLSGNFLQYSDHFKSFRPEYFGDPKGYTLFGHHKLSDLMKSVFQLEKKGNLRKSDFEEITVMSSGDKSGKNYVFDICEESSYVSSAYESFLDDYQEYYDSMFETSALMQDGIAESKIFMDMLNALEEEVSETEKILCSYNFSQMDFPEEMDLENKIFSYSAQLPWMEGAIYETFFNRDEHSQMGQATDHFGMSITGTSEEQKLYREALQYTAAESAYFLSESYIPASLYQSSQRPMNLWSSSSTGHLMTFVHDSRSETMNVDAPTFIPSNFYDFRELQMEYGMVQPLITSDPSHSHFRTQTQSLQDLGPRRDGRLNANEEQVRNYMLQQDKSKVKVAKKLNTETAATGKEEKQQPKGILRPPPRFHPSQAVLDPESARWLVNQTLSWPNVNNLAYLQTNPQMSYQLPASGCSEQSASDKMAASPVFFDVSPTRIPQPLHALAARAMIFQTPPPSSHPPASPLPQSYFRPPPSPSRNQPLTYPCADYPCSLYPVPPASPYNPHTTATSSTRQIPLQRSLPTMPQCFGYSLQGLPPPGMQMQRPPFPRRNESHTWQPVMHMQPPMVMASPIRMPSPVSLSPRTPSSSTTQNVRSNYSSTYTASTTSVSSLSVVASGVEKKSYECPRPIPVFLLPPEAYLNIQRERRPGVVADNLIQLVGKGARKKAETVASKPSFETVTIVKPRELKEKESTSEMTLSPPSSRPSSAFSSPSSSLPTESSLDSYEQNELDDLEEAEEILKLCNPLYYNYDADDEEIEEQTPIDVQTDATTKFPLDGHYPNYNPFQEYFPVFSTEVSSLESSSPTISPSALNNLDFPALVPQTESTKNDIFAQSALVKNVFVPQHRLYSDALRDNSGFRSISLGFESDISVGKKFDELEQIAIDQYKPSEESLSRQFSELEKQAMEQYSTSASNNTSAGSFDKVKIEETIVEDTQKTEEAKKVSSEITRNSERSKVSSEQRKTANEDYSPPRRIQYKNMDVVLITSPRNKKQLSSKSKKPKMQFCLRPYEKCLKCQAMDPESFQFGSGPVITFRQGKSGVGYLVHSLSVQEPEPSGEEVDKAKEDTPVEKDKKAAKKKGKGTQKEKRGSEDEQPRKKCRRRLFPEHDDGCDIEEEQSIKPLETRSPDKKFSFLETGSESIPNDNSLVMQSHTEEDTQFDSTATDETILPESISGSPNSTHACVKQKNKKSKKKSKKEKNSCDVKSSNQKDDADEKVSSGKEIKEEDIGKGNEAEKTTENKTVEEIPEASACMSLEKSSPFEIKADESSQPSISIPSASNEEKTLESNDQQQFLGDAKKGVIESETEEEIQRRYMASTPNFQVLDMQKKVFHNTKYQVATDGARTSKLLVQNENYELKPSMIVSSEPLPLGAFSSSHADETSVKVLEMIPSTSAEEDKVVESKTVLLSPPLTPMLFRKIILPPRYNFFPSHAKINRLDGLLPSLKSSEPSLLAPAPDVPSLNPQEHEVEVSEDACQIPTSESALNCDSEEEPKSSSVNHSELDEGEGQRHGQQEIPRKWRFAVVGDKKDKCSVQ